MTKTAREIELERALELKENLETEREKSNKLYASMLTQVIVFTSMGIITTVFLYNLLSLVFPILKIK